MPISPAKVLLWIAWIGSSGLWPQAQAQESQTHVLLERSRLEAELQTLPHWGVEEQNLVSICQFSDFVQTVAFVNRLVEPAETLGHHPDLFIAYNTLTLQLTTHDAGGITVQDLQLAAQISDIVETVTNLESVDCRPAQGP